MKDSRFIIESYNPEKSYTRQKKFDCGNKIINKFVKDSLKKQVRNSLSTAFVLLDTEQDDQFSAFYTLTNYKLIGSDLTKLSSGSLPREIPCVRLVMLGVDLSLQGHGIGTKMMSDCFHRVYSASKTVGCFGLYLDADPPAINFYLRLGFTCLGEEDRTSIAKMFLPISTLAEVIER